MFFQINQPFFKILIYLYIYIIFIKCSDIDDCKRRQNNLQDKIFMFENIFLNNESIDFDSNKKRIFQRETKNNSRNHESLIKQHKQIYNQQINPKLEYNDISNVEIKDNESKDLHNESGFIFNSVCKSKVEKNNSKYGLLKNQREYKSINSKYFSEGIDNITEKGDFEFSYLAYKAIGNIFKKIVEENTKIKDKCLIKYLGDFENMEERDKEIIIHNKMEIIEESYKITEMIVIISNYFSNLEELIDYYDFLKNKKILINENQYYSKILKFSNSKSNISIKNSLCEFSNPNSDEYSEINRVRRFTL